MLRTFQYRIKNPGKRLDRMAFAVNLVWNYCNELTARRWSESRQILSWVVLCRLVAGASIGLGVSAETCAQIVREHSKKRNQAKREKLSWRSGKRSLGWIPFRDGALTLKGNVATYYSQSFRLWLSRPIEGEIRNGSFSQDAEGCWYLNIVCRTPDNQQIAVGDPVGIDLGLKDQAVLSTGDVHARENITRRYADKLAKAQRARKRKRVTAIHAKIKNSRKDWAHKTTTQIVKNHSQVIVGNVSPAKLKRTRFAKSVSDAGWYQFKTMLEYKAIALGVGYNEINEAFSTVTCSNCNERSGPSGLRSVGVREWDCPNCGTHHNRDVNAARNILAFGLGHQTPKGASL